MISARFVVALGFLGTAAVAAAQVPRDSGGPRAALAGIIRDSLGQPLPFVTVTADGRDLATVSDSAGRFHLGRIPAGRQAFTLMRLGYRAVNFEINLPPDSTILVDIRMRGAQTLPQVTVAAEREYARLSRDGFYERKRVGWGKYLTPEQVDSMSHYITTPAQLLRNINGLTIRCSRSSMIGCTVRGGGDRCMATFIDGVYWRGELDQNLSIGAVFAIEVYNRAAIVPKEFAHPATIRCGAIVVWTQSRR
jgi:hypothetical protein